MQETTELIQAITPLAVILVAGVATVAIIVTGNESRIAQEAIALALGGALGMATPRLPSGEKDQK